MKTNKDYIKVNQRLQRIKDLGLTPVTLKSPSDITEKFMYQKGTSNEGLIMSYSEAAFMALNDRNENLTIEEYNHSIEVFMRDFGEQTYVQGALDRAYEIGIKILDSVYENPKIPISNEYKDLNKKDLVKLLQDIGYDINTIKDDRKRNYQEYNSPTGFLKHYDQWLENYKSQKE